MGVFSGVIKTSIFPRPPTREPERKPQAKRELSFAEQMDAFKARPDIAKLDPVARERAVFRFSNIPSPRERQRYLDEQLSPIDLSKGGVDKTNLITAAPKVITRGAKAIVEAKREEFKFTSGLTTGLAKQADENLRTSQPWYDKLRGKEPLDFNKPEDRPKTFGEALGRGLLTPSEPSAADALTVVPFFAGAGALVKGGVGATRAAVAGKTAVQAGSNLRPALSGGAGAFPIPDNIIGLRPIQPGLEARDRIANVLRRTAGKIDEGVLARSENEIATPALRERNRVRVNVENVANALGTRVGAEAPKVFDLDRFGRIPSLAGIDATLPAAPTIRDVAARLPKFAASLSSEQTQFLTTIRDDIAQFRKLRDDVGLETNTRADIMEGGFYIPRGRTLEDGIEELPKVYAGRSGGGKISSEQAARLPSETEGIEQGFEYAPLGESLTTFARTTGYRTTDAHLANYFKALGGGSTPTDRLFQQNPSLVVEIADLRRELARLKPLIVKYGGKEQATIDSFLNNPSATNLDDLRAAVNQISVGRGKSAGASVDQLYTDLQNVLTRMDNLRPDYLRAKTLAASPTRGTHEIGLSGLQGTAFPDVIANAANKYLTPEDKLGGPVLDAINSLYRGIRSTADNSAVGIQGLLASAANPKAGAKALSVNLRAWLDPNVLGSHISQFDDKATQQGRITSQVWGKEGLRIGGAQTEFELGQGALAKLSKAPVVKEANRAFGFYGDALRLELADDLLRSELARGRTVREVIDSGDIRKIAEIANNMTGYSTGKAAGSVGDLIFFAPRFLQSRLQTLAKAGMSLRPGATLDQRVARNSMMKMIGYGVILTYAANEMMGQETDPRPWVNGKYNPNFMRIRFGDRDWSIFGPWDSMARTIASAASGDVAGAVRPLASGIVSNAWDFITGADFAGNRTRDDAGDIFARLGRNLLPLSAEDMVEIGKQAAEAGQKGEVGKAVVSGTSLVGQLFGVKSAPLSMTDVRDIVSSAKFDKRYEDLNDGQKDIVNEDERIVERAGKFTPDPGSPRQQLTSAIENWNQEKTSLEERLGSQLATGMKGESLRKAIQSFKASRWERSDTLFNDDVIRDQLARDSKKAEDVLAEKYWAAPLEETVPGVFDYDKQDAAREDLLAQARGLGIDTAYITGSGLGTYRGKRFDNPEVAKAIEAYEADQEKIGNFGYFDAYKNLRGFKTRPDLLPSYREYLAAQDVAGQIAFAKKYSTNRLVAFKAADAQVKTLRESMRKANPELDVLLIKWGYVTRPLTPAGRDEIQKMLKEAE